MTSADSGALVLGNFTSQLKDIDGGAPPAGCASSGRWRLAC
ncbi:hypothetical protein ACLBOM_28380 [Escherichia coli]